MIRGRCAEVRDFAVAAALALCCSACGSPSPPGGQSLEQRREDAYRANNRGVALLEQFSHENAIAAFTEALRLDPTLRLASINLPIAQFYAGKLDEAAASATVARDAYPDAPQPVFILGLVARAQNKPDAAAQAFLRVLQIDARDVGAKVNLALVYVQQRRYGEALALCDDAVAAEPYNATAAYNRAIALTRAGRADEGVRAMEAFERLRTAPYAVTYTQTYLEQGRYAEGLASSGAEDGLVDAAAPMPTFADATASLLRATTQPTSSSSLPLPLAGSVAVTDLDADGDPDVIAGAGRVRVFTNDGTQLVESTPTELQAIGAGVTGVATGDVDNDGRADIFVLTQSGPRLFVQARAGLFTEGGAGVFRASPQTARAAALLDADHDGDLDVLVGGFVRRGQTAEWSGLAGGGATSTRLFRNAGDGTFAEVAGAAGLSESGVVSALAATDFDNRRDVDVLVASFGARPKLYRNLREGLFEDVSAPSGLPDAGLYTAMALGDVNKDGFTDAFLGRLDEVGLWALSDGRGHFTTQAAAASTRSTTAAQIADYDNDGVLDLLVAAGETVTMLRNAGRSWQEQPQATASGAFVGPLRAGGGVSALAAGDLDLDGDLDVVASLRSGDVRIWRNEGGNRNGSLRVRLAGRVSNRSAVGSRVEMRAGSLHQVLETSATTPASGTTELLFGLGRRPKADVVRVLWPSGVLQAETLTADIGRGGLALLELDRKPSSCPFLFVWNGERFEFVTDFLGGGEMGYWQAPGLRNIPDPEEFVRITDQQLRPRDGRLELRVTNELEEVLFADHFRLLAVTHRADEQVFPDEGLRATIRPFQAFVVRNVRAPLRVEDDHGHDVSARVAALDRRYPDDFERLPLRGYAREHSLTVDLPPAGALAGGRRRVLLLTGWTDYAFSSDNVAAHQAGLTLTPPALQVPDAKGGWRNVNADVGIPVGRPQTLVVDLAGVKSDRVRLVTSMRVYWDQIAVADASTTTGMEAVPMLSQDLVWRGFSTPDPPDSVDTMSYDYGRVMGDRSWKLMPGRYTREGDVAALLQGPDDRFVVAMPGDEVTLSFDATALRPLKPGERRTYLLQATGYSKEMDLHSASPDFVAPMPFRAMSRYPYAWPERYPHEDDLRLFHLRSVGRMLPPLASAAGANAGAPGTAARTGETR